MDENLNEQPAPNEWWVNEKGWRRLLMLWNGQVWIVKQFYIGTAN